MRLVFSPIMYRSDTLDAIPPDRSGYALGFVVVSGVMPNPSRTNGSTDGMDGCFLLHFCLLLRESVRWMCCCIYRPACLPACLSKRTCCLQDVGQEQDRTDGWTYMPPRPHTPRDGRRWQEGGEMKMAMEMHNTYLPTYMSVCKSAIC